MTTVTETAEQEFETNAVHRRAFVVVGMHRSGTSAMTRTLSLLGAALPKQLMPAVSDNNSAGFWEPQDIADFNDEILQAQDSEWDDVFAFRRREYLSNFDRFYIGRAVELLDRQFNGSEVIVLKDPRISVLMGFWDRALRESGYAVHYVVMVRNPIEVAESLRARDGFPREKSFLLWSSYMIAVDRDTRDRSRTFVSYEQLMSDWRGVRRRIEVGTGVPFPRDTAAAAIEIDRFLNPRMQHHAARPEDLYGSADVPDQVKALYRIFSEACQGGEVNSADLNEIQTEMEELDHLVGPLLADMRGSARALSKKVVELTDAHAGASERVASLEEHLAAEQALREAEAAAASQANAQHEAHVAELAQRMGAIETARDKFAADAEDKARIATALAERLAQMEARLADKEADLTEAQELASTAKTDLASSEDKLAQQFRELEKLTELLRKSERQIDAIETDLEETRKSAEAAANASEQELLYRARQVKELTEQLRRSEDEIQIVKRDAEDEIQIVKRDAEDVRKKAETDGKANEGKLVQRFQEMAALTRLLREQEERGERADDNLEWLVAVHEHLGKQPRSWSLRSAEWRRRRLLERLSAAGLFDGDAYLRYYPDVAEAGLDPLDHYLRHGLREGRLRRP